MAAGTIHDALRAASDCGLITSVQPVNERLHSACATDGWAAVALECSRHTGGQWWPSDSGVTWLCGRAGQWVTDAGNVADVRAARELAQRVTGMEQGDEAALPGWSIGSAARMLIKWAISPQRFEGSLNGLLSGSQFGYHDCAPGNYANLTQWDVRSCYYTLLSRLPSPKASFVNGRVLWHKPEASERCKWREVVEAVGKDKALRNSLLGCMVGRAGESTVYSKGSTLAVKGRKGPLVGGGLVVVRTACELCMASSEELSSVYSNVDCVTTGSDLTPKLWPAAGLEVRQVAVGRGEICSRGIYRVGRKTTEWYRRGSRFQVEVPRAPLPPVEVALQWL